MQRAQHEPLEAGHVVEPEGERGGGGFLQSLGRIVQIQAIEAPDRAGPVALPDQLRQLRDLDAGRAEDLLLGQHARGLAGLAALGTVLGIGDARVGAVLRTPVLGYLALTVEEHDASFVRADLQGTPDQWRGRGVAIAVEMNETLEIDDAALERVDLGHESRQGSQ